MKALTVIYHETREHFNLALKAWASFPKEVKILAVINQKYDIEYPKNIEYIANDENCLAKAWNIGLREIFKTEDYAIVSGLDSISPQLDQLEEMVKMLKENPKYGLVSAIPMDMYNGVEKVQHGDGSFSFFIISKEAFEKVGDFDERFKPAYFEDNDYLERLWKAGYTPHRALSVIYYHMFQGTIKYGTEIKRKYPVYMQKNLELFRSIYGKTPEHLPKDIKFT